jgi:pimeloyl-ACP methyl ester carboxylesterase
MSALPPPVDGIRSDVDGIAVWSAGTGPPLLLVHSVNAAASAAEMRPVFEHARSRYRVHAVELPGFGASTRGPQDYTPRLMTDAIHQVADQIARRSGTEQLDALALSLGCEFLARAAVERPQRWARLAFVSPTGFNRSTPRQGAPGSTREVPGLLKLLQVPLWSQALFDGLTRPSVVRYFLRRTWGSKEIDEGLAEYSMRTAREPGARFAPLAFLSARLFSADVQELYERLTQPVWMSHGVRGDFTDYRGKARFEGRANWRFSVFPTGALPYFERPAEFAAAFDDFFARVG